MENGQDRAQQLVRIIGSERDAHPLEVVAAAEKEIIRRLGGTRKQARRRVSVRAGFTIAAGLLTLVASLAVAATVAEELPDYIVLALAFCLGLVLLALGIASLRWKDWVICKSLLRALIGAGNLAALTAEPPLEDVLEIVGPGRASRAAEQVTAAEGELTARLGRARERMAKRVRNWGTIALLYGLYNGVAGPVVIAQFLLMARDGYPLGPGLLGALHFWMMFWMGMVSMCFGWALFAGGLGLRRRKQWARRMLVAIIWIWFACGVAMIPPAMVWMLLAGAGKTAAGVLLTLAVVPVNGGLWLLVLSGITRLLSRPEVREVCEPHLREEAHDARRRLRHRIVLAVAIVMALPLIAAVTAYGIWWWRSAAALDKELLALRESGAVIDLEQWKPPLPPQEENGAELFGRAFAELHKGEERIREAGWPPPAMPQGEAFKGWWDLVSLDTWTPEQAAYADKVLSELGQALQTMREAVTRPHVNFDWDYSWDTCVPELEDMRSVARLASLSAALSVHNGDFSRALDEVKLLLRLARFPDGDHLLLLHLVRMSFAMLGETACERTVRTGEVPTGQLEDLDALLREARAGLDPPRAMACERAWLIACWKEIKAGRWELLDQPRASRLKAFLLQPLLSSRMTTAVGFANEAVRISTEPLWQAIPELESLERRIEHERDGREWEGTLQFLGPQPVELLAAYAHGAQAYARCDALLDSLRIAIALRRYKADRGQPAQALTELVPAYLPELPPDPFTGRDFLTKRADGMLTVYSVGENLKDDGGNLEEDKWGHSPDLGVRISE